MKRIKIGTRGSRLALIQAEMYRKTIEESGYDTEIVRIESEGDRDKTSPLRQIRKRGIFSSTLNDRILAGDIDIAVHSAKDLPTFLPEGVQVAGVLPRGAPEDVLISPVNLYELSPGSTVGTSSERRRIELLNHRPDLVVKDIRGNIETRIGKISSGEYDAVIVANAAYQRLNLNEKHEVLGTDEFPPAPNQGIIAATAIPDTDGFIAASQATDHKTMNHFLAEKTVLETMRFSCDDPVSVYCRSEQGADKLTLRVYSLTGRQYLDFVNRQSEDIASVIAFAEETKNKIPASYGYRWPEKST